MFVPPIFGLLVPLIFLIVFRIIIFEVWFQEQLRLIFLYEFLQLLVPSLPSFRINFLNERQTVVKWFLVDSVY